jgi:hypothetical protein
LWIFFPRPGAGRFQTFEKKLHKYSGLDPEEWGLFLKEIREFDRNLVAEDLYKSLEHVRNLSLARPNLSEEINAIADLIGYEGEVILNQIAVTKGTVFRPKFLNEVIPDQPLTLYLNDSKPMDTIDANPIGANIGSGALGGHHRA